MRVEAITRKCGNSIGVTLPKDLLEKEKIGENEKISIDVHKTEPLKVKDIFGKLKGWNIDSQKFKDDRRKEDAERDRKLSGLLRHHRNTERKSKI